MKKILTIMIAAVAISSQAASFSWSAGDIVKFDGTTLAGNAKGYLVYMGTSTDLTSLYTIDYTAPGTITPAASVMDKSTATGRAAGKLSMVKYDDAEHGFADGEQVKTGATFGLYLLYTDEAGKQWYNFSSTVATMATDTTGAFESQTFAFNFGTKTEITSSAQSVSAGGGWYSMNVAPIPEPSTAALALAGLALLLKRRKA